MTAGGTTAGGSYNVDFASLKSINDDVIGWIYMEALPQISYPMV